jgi:hypothetical protein
MDNLQMTTSAPGDEMPGLSTKRTHRGVGTRPAICTGCGKSFQAGPNSEVGGRYYCDECRQHVCETR